MHTAEDVVATIAHEIAGHFGLREMLGNRYNQTMNDLYSGNAAVRDAADEKLKNSKNLSREVAVEEVLAEMAEKPTNTAAERSVLQRVFDYIKTFLNKMFRGQVISDDAVRQIVANANRYVVEGTRPEEYQNVGVYTSAKGESLFRTKKEPTAYGSSFIAKEQNAKDKMLGSIMGLTGRVQFVDRFAALSEALKKGKPGTPAFHEALRSALENVRNVVGTHGIYNMTPTNHNGVDERARVLVQVDGGNWRLKK
jgi:hypothetical protein